MPNTCTASFLATGLPAGSYASRDYDYSPGPSADLGASRKDPRPTGHADQEVYQWHDASAGSHSAQPRAGMQAANDPQGEGRANRLAAHAGAAHPRREGAGQRQSARYGGRLHVQNWRGIPESCANAEYLILETRFLIEDVAQDSQAKEAAAGRKQQWRVSVDLTAHPVVEVLRPVLARSKPFTQGPQVARRRRARRREPVDRRARPHQGAVPLGPAGPEEPAQHLLDSRELALGGQPAGRRAHAAHRAGGHRRFHRRRSGPAGVHGARAQPVEPAAVGAARTGGALGFQVEAS
jgi:hypothetical protein